MTLDNGEGLDLRSALVLVEPVFAPGEVIWHGMAFAGGKTLLELSGSNRGDVLGQCLAALDEANVEVRDDAR